MNDNPNLEAWRDCMLNGRVDDLDTLLHDDACFISPVVHTPQRGKALAKAYLAAAEQVLGNESFQYTREFDCGTRAVLEFETRIGDIVVNGVDMIEWDEDGKITEFKVMVRPLKAIEAVHAEMARMLESLRK